jgi:hypothetical protein
MPISKTTKKSSAGPAWSSVKSALQNKTPLELLKIMADLYALNPQNKRFMAALISVNDEGIMPYKKIITQALYPDFSRNEDVQLAVGRKAIADYFKATKDKSGQLSLMLHFFETGNKCTLDYGDMYEGFYTSLEKMLDKILGMLKVLPEDVAAQYIPRIQASIFSVRGTGWGYYDYINQQFESFVQE